MKAIKLTLKRADSHEKVFSGLSEKEARRRLEKYGTNTITRKKKISAFKILVEQFYDFMVLILLVSTGISAFMGETTEALTIIAIVVVNAVLGFMQEYKTEKTLDALRNLAAPTAKVIREGEMCSVPAETVVPGDLIALEAGDRIPADAVLVDSQSLQVDESLLTGESIPVEKESGKNIKKEGDRTESSGAVYMGTIVTRGRGKAIIHATGMNTEMGKIADMIQNIDAEETPLQRRLNHLGRFIAFGCLCICAVVSLAGIMRGESVFTMLLAGISLAVAAVPEGLPAIVTISLAIGVQRMLGKNALVRKLPAVETLGCATVICSDKTGTLTENRMSVRKIYAGETMVEIRDDRNGGEGTFSVKSRRIDPMKYGPLKLVLEIGGLCNNAAIVKTPEDNIALGRLKSVFSAKGSWRIEGDPTEGALLIASHKGGLSSEMLEKSYFRIDELPFDPERKAMSVICDNHRGETFVFTKGAPDMIIQKCTKILTSTGVADLNPILKAAVMRVNDSMASEALRVLGMAYKKLPSRSYAHGDIEKGLVFAGLVGMMDPPRKEAGEAVSMCKLAGIKPVMITGDHKATAAAVAGELGIYSRGEDVLTGADLDKMDEESLAGRAGNVSVYARVSPKHKLMIVRALKKTGNIVAMTGDGVNDAPAVKEADIGVSMGMTGTDVTKEASSMILLDDNFATIVAAISEGRVIFDNIRKFIRYMLSCNLGEVLVMFLGMLAGLPIPLYPIQVLWVNLVTDGLPAIALGLDPPDRDIMTRPPRGAKESVFSRGLLRLILFRGALIGFCTLAVFTSILFRSDNPESARTAAFATLVITQLIHVFECKSERKNIFEIPVFDNMPLVLSVICSLLMLLGVIYIPALQGVFSTMPLGSKEWIIIIGFSALGPAVSSFFRPKRR